MRLDDIYLAGIGVFIPDIVSTRDAVERGLYDAEVAAESGWTGVAVAGDLPAPDMAVLAAKQAMSRSGHLPSDFALLVHACNLPQGPDIWPAQSYIQLHTIGGDAPSMELGQNCNGMLAAMELSCCYLKMNDAAAAMITGADNFGTPLFDRYRYATGAGTNRASIMGDAGGAVVLSRRGGFARLRAIKTMSVPRMEEMFRSGVQLFPPESTVGKKADVGGRLAHYREHNPEGALAAKDALQRARTILTARAMAEAEIESSQITRVTHVFSGGEGYIKSVLAPLGIDVSLGMLEFGRRVGHLGPCDQIVGLDHLLLTGAVGPGDHVLMLSNGGVSLSCAIVEIIDRPAWVAA
jgi:3-oxoacyl-[acyl-carrier-protein] synthase-3